MQNAICFLTTNVNIEIFNFAETLKQDSYDIYICVDNNDIVIPESDFDKINIIRINNEECKINGFTGSVVYCLDRACARDKALYYFCKLNTSYNYIWFIEQDVFIPDNNTIKNLDQKYNYGDLLCEGNYIKKSAGDHSHYWEHWPRLNNIINYPWSHSLICAVRVSKLLLNFISEFATKNKVLLFDETLFNTIALQNNLTIINPIELSTITFVFNNDIEINENNYNKLYLYHPVRNISKHQILRDRR